MGYSLSNLTAYTYLKADAHMAICGAAAVPIAPGAPGHAGAQCIHAAAAVDGSTAGCPRVKFSLQRSLRESRIFLLSR